MQRVFTKRIENILQHKDAYEKRIVNSIERKLEMMLIDLEEELCAGHIPSDFKVRIDTIYQKIMCKWNYV
jgi:hypothetical protein